MSLINVLVINICLSILTSPSSEAINCTKYRLSHDVEDTAFQLFKTLKMPKESRYFKKSIQDLILYMLFKNVEEDKYKTLKDIVNVSRHFDIDEEVNSFSNLDTMKIEESIGNTILHELVSNIPLIVQNVHLDANISLECVRDYLSKKVNTSLLNETNVQLLNKSGRTVNIPNKRKNGLEAWVYNKTRRPTDDINIENYSFMVSIFENGDFVCSGSIIGKELVISAASCLHGVYLNKGDWPAITLRVLSDFIYRGGYIISVTEAIFHPQYDHNTMLNNLVLLHVPKGSFTKLTKIRRLVYEETRVNDDINATVIVLGWNILDSIMGKTNVDMPMTTDQLKVYDVNECDEFYSRQALSLSSKIQCTGFSNFRSRKKYAVGSPSIKNNMLLGILSLTSEPARTKEARVVFTRIAPYITWIHEAQRKIIPILHGIGENGLKRNGTLIKARRTGSRAWKYHSKKHNSNKTRNKQNPTKIISHGQVGLDVTNFSDFIKSLSLDDVINANSSLDAIKDRFLGALVNSPEALYSLAAKYLKSKIDTKKTDDIKRKETHTRTEKEKEEFNLNWNVFFEDDGTTAITEVSTTIRTTQNTVEELQTTQNTLEDMSPEKETNPINKKKKKHVKLSSSEINDLAALIVRENLRKTKRKRRILKKKT